MKSRVWVAICVTMGMMMPDICLGQSSGMADDIRSLHEVLEQLYTDMMPLCSNLIGVGRGLAGFGATWYIAVRVWRHIANAEPIDFYPLFRPFVLGFAVLIFPSVISMINGVMKPTVSGTQAMVENSDKAIAELLKRKEAAIKQTIYWQMYVGNAGEGNYDKWYKYTFDEEASEEGWMEGIGNNMRFAMAKFSYNFKNSIKEFISTILKVLFEAAALCVNTVRTFFLIVLAILGPLVFGLAVYDGFQHTLTVWLARYINIFLWLPVANIFGVIIGKIQENMLKVDIGQIEQTGNTFFSSTDMAYMVFMIIGIVGYFTVPGIANYIVNAGGGNSILHKVTSLTMQSGATVAAGGVSMSRDALGGAYNRITNSMASVGASDGYFGSYDNTSTGHLKNKLKGNSKEDVQANEKS